MATKKLYTTPIVCKYQNEWFVFFRFWNNDTKKYITKKIARAAGQDLNRIKDLKERENEFNALREARENWLKMGWNPIIDPEFNRRDQLPAATQFAEIQLWTVEKALQHALKFKKLAVKSKYDYKKSVEYFLNAARELSIHTLPISTLIKTHVKAVFAVLAQDLPPKNYNKRLMHIKSLLSELVEWHALVDNPAYRIKDLPEETTEKFKPYTDEERLMIKEYLYITHYRFFVFWATIYYTGVRPDEILSLRIKSLNFKDNTIHLLPFSQVVKNKKERFVTLHPDIMMFYKEMALHTYPEDYYIFSVDFMPGEKKIRRQVASDLWKELVKEQLGIDKYMYAGKHSGAAAFIKAGASEDNLVDHFGHSSRFITRMYTNEGVKQSQQIINKLHVDF